MLLKVLYPHEDELGKRYMAGDYREVPDHMVAQMLRPQFPYGFAILARDPYVSETEAKVEAPAPQPDKTVVPAPVAVVMLAEDPKPEPEAPAFEPEPVVFEPEVPVFEPEPEAPAVSESKPGPGRKGKGK